MLAVPITYITVDDPSSTTYSVLTERTTLLENATIAVHTILAEWRQADATAVAGGLDDDDEDLDGGDGDDGGGDGQNAGGLSDYAKAGVGVGVGIGALLICAVLFLVFWRKRGGSAAGTNKWAGHEMETVHGQRSGGGGGGSASVGAGRGSVGGIGDLGVEISPKGGGAEMLVLREQKEAIQRRIEALEKSDKQVMR